jgi:hypothetical protein
MPRPRKQSQGSFTPGSAVAENGLLMAEEVERVRLNPETLRAFEAYVLEAETLMEQTLHAGVFLWSDADAARARRVRQGKIVAEFWPGKGAVRAPAGVIHDWIGAAFVPGATIERTLACVQDYDNHKHIYKPEVMESRLISRNGNQFQIYLRLLKKKIITVVLDTDHDVLYLPLDGTRWSCRSYTTRTCEVDDAGKPNEKVHPPDTGYGFLWRLNSYWRFQERDGGVYIECRALSLTRDIPRGLGWIVEPIARTLPGESLIATLRATRCALTVDR